MIKYNNNNIRELREINNWSQEYVAERMHMTKNGYAKIERGESSINMERLKQLADIFEIDVVKLMESDNKGVICLIGDNSNSKNSNCYSTPDNEIEKLNLVIEHKEELLAQAREQIIQLKDFLVQKDAQIETLNLLIETLKK